MARKRVIEEGEQAPVYQGFLSKGKKLIKVCNNPNTWVEMDANATEEQIQAKIEKYKKSHPSLTDMISSGELKIDDKEMKKSHKPYTGYSGPIYSLPKLNSSQLKW